MAQDQRASLWEHLGELRRRLFHSVLFLVATTIISLVFYRQEIQVLLYPARHLLSLTGKPVFLDVTELLGVIMKVSLLFGFLGALPFILYQVVMFVAPGLTTAERRYAFSIIPFAVLMFAGGVAFSYWVLLPPALRFLLTFGSELATPMIRIGTYINLIVTLMFWMGVIFETPLVIYVVARLGIVSPEALARGRRFALVGAFLLGAVITPTFDPINQTLVAAPLFVLYEMGIWLAKLAARQRRVARPAAQARQRG
ncbi:MAG: twin-arginine translocase subunit TatC [Chloroflexi bacterium]|nr:twin-arginine translocase subunit TatC [Chloroflexota bacterium]